MGNRHDTCSSHPVRSGKGLKFVHLNICHLLPKVSQLQDLLYRETKDVPNICGISESYLNESILDNEIIIPGFNVIRRDRPGRSGGGVVVYVLDRHSYVRRTDLEWNFVESIWIELKITNSKPCIICNVYRPPDSTPEWYVRFENQLEKAFAFNYELIILGDLNLNMLGRNIDKDWLNI